MTFSLCYAREFSVFGETKEILIFVMDESGYKFQ